MSLDSWDFDNSNHQNNSYFYTLNSWVDPGFFLGRGAPLRHGITNWWRKQILKVNMMEKAFDAIT